MFNTIFGRLYIICKMCRYYYIYLFVKKRKYIFFLFEMETRLLQDKNINTILFDVSVMRISPLIHNKENQNKIKIYLIKNQMNQQRFIKCNNIQFVQTIILLNILHKFFVH